MKSTEIWSYIYVGTCLRYLQDATEGDDIHSDGAYLANIDFFLASLDALALNVTQRACGELLDFRAKLAEKPSKSKLTKIEASKLGRIADDIRLTFEAETRGIFTYVVTDKRLDVKRLLADVSGLFAPDVFDKCPEIARYDFQEGGRCIAFERSTAAAFHLMRGTEAVLKSYYKRYIRPAQPNLTWGQMTHALRSKTRGKKPEPLVLANLDHIRQSFRNPTKHPEKIYDIQEVQDLFGLCIDVVNRMVKAIGM